MRRNPFDIGVNEAIGEIYGKDVVTDPDPDGELEALGPDPDAIATAAEVDISDELDEDDMEDELFDLAAEEVSSDAGEDISARFGRRAVASRIRRAFQPKIEIVEAFGAGYVKALDDLGVPSDEAKERFGGVSKSIGKVASAATRGFLGGSVRDAASKLTGGKSIASLAEQAGASLRQQVRFGPLDALMAPQDRASADVGVEADSASLPPVYVEDEAGFDEDSADLDTFESYGAMHVQDQFGAVCRYGFVGGQPRKRARLAAHRAVMKAQKDLPRRTRGKKSKPFVEDPEARPMLFSDGKIIEPAYGALCPVPCPSCTRTVDSAAAKGAATTCVVCEGYGAILVPKDDLSTYTATEHYGVIPLLVPAAIATGKAITEGKLFPKAAENVKHWFKNAFKKRDDDSEEDSDVELSDDQTPVRALVPRDGEEAP